MSDTETPTEQPSSTTPHDADGAEDSQPQQRRTGRQVSISLRGLVIGSVTALLAATIGVLGWLYADATAELRSREQADRDRAHAQEVALNYAVHAAEMDHRDFATWKGKLVNGTSPELTDKLGKAADSMQEILTPLQWTSSARPLAAKVSSDTGGIYVVDAFVSVLTKTVQSPEGMPSTATYRVTMDGRNNWQITDVGGIDAALGK